MGKDEAMIFGRNDKVVMIGDSVTDCGRARPMGEGKGESLGNGYVSNVDALLAAAYPRLFVRVVNMGVSGNNVRDLRARWQTDVLDLKPDWVSIMIGINDVWRQYDRPRQTECHVHIDEYRRTLDELVAKTLPAVKGLLLITPYFIEPNRKDAMRKTMDRYGQAVKVVARRRGVVLVDTQAAFNAALKCFYSATIALDRAHPNHIGHMILARAFLHAVGFRW